MDDREPDFPQKVMNAGLGGLCGELEAIHLVHHHALKRMAVNIALYCRRVADIGPMIEI